MQENFDEVMSPYIKKTGVKEVVSHWSGKSFYIPWTIFNVWKATAIYRGLAILRAHRPNCLKHNHQHAEHANARGLGDAPGKF